MRYTSGILFMLIAIFASPVLVDASIDDEAKETIKKHYVDHLPEDKYELPLQELLQEMDPYSRYVTQEELNNLYGTIDQEITGIGITLSGNVIDSIIPRSPASSSRLKVGDELVEVNGVATEGLSPEALKGLFNGGEGAAIVFTVVRDEERFTLSLVKETFTVPSVTYQQLAGDIGYMYISSFSQKLKDDFKEIVNTRSPEHWIIDIRSNPGGYVQAAQELAGFFPEVENALLVEHRGVQEPWKPLPSFTYLDAPVSLLINGTSASASEITAGFFKDYDLGTIYGSSTYGKGLMQQAFPLDSGGALLLSINRFYTPKGEQIQGIGIEPDVTTFLPLLDSHYDAIKTVTSYPEFIPIEEVSEEKVFTIELNTEASLSSLKDHTRVYQLGGDDVEFKFAKKNSTSFTLDPETLVSGAEYVIEIEEGWKTISGAEAPEGLLQRFYVN